MNVQIRLTGCLAAAVDFFIFIFHLQGEANDETRRGNGKGNNVIYIY